MLLSLSGKSIFIYLDLVDSWSCVCIDITEYNSTGVNCTKYNSNIQYIITKHFNNVWSLPYLFSCRSSPWRSNWYSWTASCNWMFHGCRRRVCCLCQFVPPYSVSSNSIDSQTERTVKFKDESNLQQFPLLVCSRAILYILSQARQSRLVLDIGLYAVHG